MAQLFFWNGLQNQRFVELIGRLFDFVNLFNLLLFTVLYSVLAAIGM